MNPSPRETVSHAEHPYWGRGRAGCQGFTLIELLISVSLGAIVLSAVYSAYSGAIRSSQRVEQAAGEIQAWRFLVERLRADLVSLRLPRNGDDGIQGDAQSLVLTTLEPGTGPARVTYKWQGKSRQSVIHREATSDAGPRVTAVYEGADEVRFRYLTDKGWNDRFEGAEELPRLVECTLTARGRQRRIALGIEIDPPPEDR